MMAEESIPTCLEFIGDNDRFFVDETQTMTKFLEW